jgi:hypothetical protein
MLNVKTVVLKNHLWISYNRFVIETSFVKKGVYFHCTCQSKTQHGTVDVRRDGLEAFVNHQCHFDGLSSAVDMMFQSHQRQREVEFNSADTDRPSHATPTDEVITSWIIFQNSLDLSFRGAVSTPLLNFAYSLIRLGQENSTAHPNSLIPPLDRRYLSQQHGSLAFRVKKERLNNLKGTVVCVLFDATKIGTTQFLVVYLSSGSKEPPLFYSLETNVSTQAEYAQCANKVCCDLFANQIQVVSFCTDGLRHQVRAISDSSKVEDRFYYVIALFSFFLTFFLFKF